VSAASSRVEPQPPALARATDPIEQAIARIRHRSFRAVRLGGTVVGIALAAHMSVLVKRGAVPGAAGVPLVALLVTVISVSWLFTEQTCRFGAGLYIATVSILTCAILGRAGMTVGVGLALAWICVAAAVFHGMRAGLVALLGVALLLLAYGAWRHLGGAPADPWPGAVLVPTAILVRYSLTLLGLIGLLLTTVGVVVDGFEKSNRELGEALASERAANEARQASDASRLLLERSLRRAQKMESIGRLACGAVHDFNNALGVILACAAELAEAVPADRRADVEAIATSARSSTILARSLLSLARSEAAAAERLVVQSLLRRLVEVLQRTLPKNISVVAEWPGACGELVVRGNRSDLEHSLLNLALNARDAMPRGGRLTLSCRACTRAATETTRHPELTPGHFVEIGVEDTGAGIPADVLPQIFEPLFTTKADGEGTGLGLFSVQRVVRSHGGAVHVRTEPGKGTLFTLLLPAERGDPAALNADRSSPLT
jgi:signal transduction histidine kinase